MRFPILHACVGPIALVAACVAREPANLAGQRNTVSGGWIRLAQPPRQVEELLAHPDSVGAAIMGRPLYVVWFQSEDGRVIRYCQYATSRHECDGTPDYQDFERANDVWTREGGGSGRNLF
jgi:hypothetical protein